MALLGFNIPEGVMWGDYFYESDSDSVRTLEYTTPESDGEWEVVGAPKLTRCNAIIQETAKPAKWCRDGNACEWKNCKFRHERCSHYDNWIARGKRGNNCRCCVTDPDSKKRPEDGGCMYDHRDVSKLKMFIESVPCSTEEELWNNFYDLGLEGVMTNVYDTRNMAKQDKSLLTRSLKANNVEFEDRGHRMYIYMV
jgi:hypothetical protein